MKGLVWFALGVTVTAVVVLKAKDLYRKATPQGMQEQFAATTERGRDRVSEFFAVAREAAAQREVEIREALGLDEQVQAEAGNQAAAARHAATA